MNKEALLLSQPQKASDHPLQQVFLMSRILSETRIYNIKFIHMYWLNIYTEPIALPFQMDLLFHSASISTV